MRNLLRAVGTGTFVVGSLALHQSFERQDAVFEEILSMLL